MQCITYIQYFQAHQKLAVQVIMLHNEFPINYLWELLGVDVFLDSRAEILEVSLICAVNLAFLFDTHIRIRQNELTNRLKRYK